MERKIPQIVMDQPQVWDTGLVAEGGKKKLKGE